MLGDEIRLELESRARPLVRRIQDGSSQVVATWPSTHACNAPGHGLTIRTSTASLTELAAPGSVIPPGRYIVLSKRRYQDVAGCWAGSSAFFYDEGRHRGTGLGLSMVYGIVRQLGGHLVVRVLRAGAAASSCTSRRPRPAGGRGLPPGAAWGGILVVEDQAVIRSLAQRTLSRAGYLVVTAESGEEARVVGRRTTRIHLIVMDIGLPGERGPAVARDLRELHPAARILYISGNLGMREEDTTPDGPHWFLQKPFSPEQLLTTVRTALDAPVPSGIAPGTPGT
jgi:two-component system cell cycle sensor histidine kinase/response regulator CckA